MQDCQYYNLIIFPPLQRKFISNLRKNQPVQNDKKGWCSHPDSPLSESDARNFPSKRLTCKGCLNNCDIEKKTH